MSNEGRRGKNKEEEVQWCCKNFQSNRKCKIATPQSKLENYNKENS